MIVNPMLKLIFKEISSQTVTYMNFPDKERKYTKRILKIFKEQLTEEEQIYILTSIAVNLHYRTIVTDPDNVLTLHTIRLRNITYMFFLVLTLMVSGAVLFKTNSALNGILDMFGNVFKLLVI